MARNRTRLANAHGRAVGKSASHPHKERRLAPLKLTCLRVQLGSNVRRVTPPRGSAVAAHHLPRHQRRDAVAGGLGADLGHHGVHLAGLDVRDAHVGRPRQSFQFALQLRRAQVAADGGQFDVVVAEGGLDHQRAQRQAGQAVPQREVGVWCRW